MINGSSPDPFVYLTDLNGGAVIVEAKTGISYALEPDGIDGGCLYEEGFLLPVHISEAAKAGKTLDDLLDAVTYWWPPGEGVKSLRPDPTRDAAMRKCIAVLTDYGPGWLIWQDGRGNGKRSAAVPEGQEPGGPVNWAEKLAG